MIWKGTEDRCAGKHRRRRQRRGRLRPAPAMYAFLLLLRLSSPRPGCMTGRTGRYFVTNGGVVQGRRSQDVRQGGVKPRELVGRCMKKTFCQKDAESKAPSKRQEQHDSPSVPWSIGGLFFRTEESSPTPRRCCSHRHRGSRKRTMGDPWIVFPPPPPSRRRQQMPGDIRKVRQQQQLIIQFVS